MTPKTDTELLDLISKNEAWLTFASSMAGTSTAWRCHAAPQHFSLPDIRERIERTGYGATAREAIEACFK